MLWATSLIFVLASMLFQHSDMTTPTNWRQKNDLPARYVGPSEEKSSCLVKTMILQISRFGSKNNPVISTFPSKCCLWNVSLLGNVFIFLQQKQASVFWLSRRRRSSLVSLPVTEGRRWKSSQLHVDLDMWERRWVVTASQVHWVHVSCAPLAHVTVHTLICFWELLSQKLLSHWLCRINILEKKTVYSW